MESTFEIILRTAAVYLFIILALRLFGKKELAQLSVIDLVFILLISNSVQNAMVGADNSLTGGIIAAGTLFVFNFVLKFILYRSKKVSGLLQGEPVLLIHNGNVIGDNLEKEKITLDELHAVIREHGISQIKDVNLAVLETDGNIRYFSYRVVVIPNTFSKHASCRIDNIDHIGSVCFRKPYFLGDFV